MSVQKQRMKKAVVVGGSNGIGLSLALSLQNYSDVYIVDRQAFAPPCELPTGGTQYHAVVFDLLSDDYALFDQFADADTLIITAGVGRLALFGDTREEEIDRSFRVNTVGPMRIIRRFYDRISAPDDDFYCVVMASIAGHLSSPFFSIYSATKAALHRFIESVNIELEQGGTKNRILEVSPGSIEGTNFYGGDNDLSQTLPLAEAILQCMYGRETCYIPQYEAVFKEVIARYQSDPHRFGLESFAYKQKRMREKK